MDLATQAVTMNGAASQAIVTGAGFFAGYTVRETTGVASVFRIWDNAAAASGPLLATIALAANQSADVLYPSNVFFTAGLFLERVAGASHEGSVRIS